MMYRAVVRATNACLFLLITAPLVAAEEREGPAPTVGYSFLVDGEQFQPRAISLNGNPDALQAGDLISVNRMLLVLPGPSEYRFRTTDRKDGRLYLVEQDGAERVVGVKIGWTYADDEKVILNPLPQLTPAETEGLWGIHIDQWVPGLDKRLAQVKLERCCVTITDQTVQAGGKLPPLPKGLHYLNVDESSNQGITDYGPLARQSQLRYFRLDAMTVDAFDTQLLADNVELRYLDLRRQELLRPEALGRLRSLRVLQLGGSDDLVDISFVRSQPNLRFLDVSRSGVTDLSPCGELAVLTALNADMAPVAELPAGPMPALTSLRIFSTRVSEEQAAAFADRHPRCRVWHGWVAAFRQSIEGVTRIRVRSGGTCHRDIEQEKTHFEVKRPAEIRRFVDAIAIDEARSGFHCMCCGDPSFEFFREDELVVTLGFHHGQSLRWPGGWPADGMMTAECASFVNDWLADHGITGPREEARETNSQRDAIQRRVAEYERILPREVLSALRKARSRENAVAAFKENVKDPAGRAALCLRLYGCDAASWNISAALDEFLRELLLPEVSKTGMLKAMGAVVDDPAGVNGAARWLFGERQWKQFDRDALDALWPKLAAHGLSHPREFNRRLTMIALMTAKSESGVAALRTVLAGELKVRELPEGERAEPGGMISFSPGDDDLPEDCSDRARAALALAKIGDRGSLPAIRQLARSSRGIDRKVFQEAMEILARESDY
jgi:hypothetical protein